MSFGPNYFILQSFTHLLSPFSTLKLHPWLKPHGLHMTSKAHRLSWSASGFAVSRSANIIGAVRANTYTHISLRLRQAVTSDGLFPSMDNAVGFTLPCPWNPACFPSVPHFPPELFSLSYQTISYDMTACIWVPESVCVYKWVCSSICAWKKGCESC